jgi:ubiquinone/menaquinone biosynthesis C-methylase UbiE
MMKTMAFAAATEDAKREAVRQWTADPCGPEITARRGTREAIEQLLSGRHAYAPWLTETLSYRSTAGLDVLDVGCGQGIDLVEYARAGAHATGVDLTPRHVELARGHLDAMGLAANVVQGDAERLPFADASFDRVSSNGVLHHTPDMPEALREIRRVLRLGGSACVIVYNRHSFHYWISQVAVRGILLGALLREGSMAGVLASGVELSSIDARPLVRVYSARRLRQMLVDAGFADVRVSVRGFKVEDTPISAWLAAHTHALHSRRLLDGLGRLGGWYVIGVGRRRA